jgi:hypothetical protein
VNHSVYKWDGPDGPVQAVTYQGAGTNGKVVAAFVDGEEETVRPDPDDPSNTVDSVVFKGGRVPLGHVAYRKGDGPVEVAPLVEFLETHRPHHHH